MSNGCFTNSNIGATLESPTSGCAPVPPSPTEVVIVGGGEPGEPVGVTVVSGNISVDNFDEMPIGIEANLAAAFCVVDELGNLIGKTFLGKITDEETGVSTYEKLYVPAGGEPESFTGQGTEVSCDMTDKFISQELGCIFKDELDAKVYQGKLIATFDGITTEHIFAPLDGDMVTYDAVTHGYLDACPVDVDFPDQRVAITFEKCYDTGSGVVTVKGSQIKGSCIPTCELIASVSCSTDVNNPVGTDVSSVPVDWSEVPCSDCGCDPVVAMGVLNK